MNVLVINAGSSSLKYQLMNPETGDVSAKGICERIGLDGRFTYKAGGKTIIAAQDVAMPTHKEAIEAVLTALENPEYGVISSLDEIDAVGHRVLHGGMEFTHSCLIDEKCKAAIRKCIPLGPLHNPANLMGIEACEKVMPGKPQVAVFDTAFHMTMPPEAYIYAIPYEYYENDEVRRYGFHGTSHRFISHRALELLGRDKNPEGTKIVSCHLGGGSSLCAVKDGKCVDTTMGLGPLAGVPMGTRSGDIDATIMDYLMERHGYDIKEMVSILNKKSGVLGISGISSDFRDLENAEAEGNMRAKLALDKFFYEVRKEIGAYAAAMGGVDAIVFAGGVGENGKENRSCIMEGLEFLGAKLDPVKNNVRAKEAEISTDDSTVRVFVIPTNEELVIARDTAELAKTAK